MFTGLGLFFITDNPLQILLGCSGVLPIAGARIFRYFRDKTQKDVANELGVSQVQVSRLESKILDKIKEKLQ